MCSGDIESVNVSDIERAIQDSPREGLPALLGELARLQGLVLARLVAPVETSAPEPVDKLLNVDEAAARTGLTVKQLKSRRLPFKRRLGHRTIMYSSVGIERWLRRSS